MLAFLTSLALSTSQPCTLPIAEGSQTPPPDVALASVVLPASLDPTGCAQELAHGTRVFKIPTIVLSWPDNGGEDFTIISGYGFTQRTDGPSAIFEDECGNEFTYPANVSIDRRSYAFAFFAPSQSLTRKFCKHKPDYVVP